MSGSRRPLQLLRPVALWPEIRCKRDFSRDSEISGLKDPQEPRHVFH